ncbi:MAG: poly-gamma-glutamate hydrolase family protein [Elusimicrobia bacterium]|nr:poly-gamma-glutamate hydrolase family protein [Elusimicrobiota bacterium]
MRLIFRQVLAGLILAVPAAAAADRYPDLATLKKSAQEGKDYAVRFDDRRSSVAVFAIHGGNIEPGTSEAALAVAGEDWSYYLFECPGSFEACRPLHVTSARFDDPAAVALATSSVVAVSLHGARETRELVCVGGANAAKRASVAASLRAEGLTVEQPCKRLPGASPKNIVNRASQGGVQLEISVPLCRKLESDERFRKSFGAAVRRGLD